MTSRFAAFALMLGNLVTGVSILAPAAMLNDLADGLAVSIRSAGLLITFGAVVLCFGSPLMVWATSAVDRRRLLAIALAVLAVGHLASALAPDYASLLAIRIVMLVINAAYTPVAAGTISQIVSQKQRPAAIAFVFLGWSLAVAAGLPLVTFMAANIGWREAYGVIAIAATLAFALVMISVPPGLREAPISLKSWASIFRSPLIATLLSITILWTAGQFSVFAYIAPLIGKLGNGGPKAIGLSFALMGIMGFCGNVAATQIVSRHGAFRTSVIFLLALLIGAATWAFGAGSLVAMVAGCAIWGLGFAAFNSMQQARLVAAAPALASATVALNTSSNYVGQAIGSALGAELFARELFYSMGYADVAFMAAAMVMLIASRRLR